MQQLTNQCGTGLSFWTAAFGTAIIIVSPFAGAGSPQMSNYVPVLQHPLFFAGLLLFAAGICSHLIRTVVTRNRLATQLSGTDALQAGITISTMLTALAFVAVIASWRGIPRRHGRPDLLRISFLGWWSRHAV